MQDIDFPLIATGFALSQLLDGLGLGKRLPARLLAGAVCLLALYALFADIRAPVSKEVAERWGLLASAALLVTIGFSMWKRRNDPPENTKEPSPARLAVSVILVCGGAIVAMLVDQGSPRGPYDLVIPAAALAGTVLIAWLAWRFATEHGDEIGEARFDTSHAPGPAERQA